METTYPFARAAAAFVILTVMASQMHLASLAQVVEAYPLEVEIE